MDPISIFLTVFIGIITLVGVVMWLVMEYRMELRRQRMIWDLTFGK